MGYLLMRREEKMKTTMINKILRVLAVFFFCLTTFTASAVNLKGGEVLYLKPNDNWKTNARFAVFLCNGTSGDKWVDMSDCNGDGTYELVVPAGDWKNVIFSIKNNGKM